MRESMQDVGQHELLVLLLMVEADLHERRQRGQGFVVRFMEEFHDRGIDMPAIGGDFLGAGAGEVAALVPGVPRAGADIIGIEQEGVVGMERLVALAVLAEQELLEKPGGMGAVPLRRAGVRHRLDQLVFRREGSRAALGLVADGEESLHQSLRQGAGIGEQGRARGGKRSRGGCWFRHGSLRVGVENVAPASGFPGNGLS